MGCSTASRWLGRVAATWLLATPAAATAGDPPAPPPSTADATLAQSLFDRGRELLEAGRASEACPLLAESYRLDPGGGALLNLAVCYERNGKLASAYASFSEALSQAIRDGREDRKKIAEDGRRDVEPRLSRLTLEVPSAARVAGLEIRVDETAWTPATWGLATPVDGGPHVVEAKAPGHEVWSTRFDVAAEHEERVVTVPVLARIGPTTAPNDGSIAADGSLRCAKGWVFEDDHCVRGGDNPYIGWAIASFVTGGLLFWGTVGTGYAWAISAATNDDSTADVVGPLTLAFGGGTVLFITVGVVLVVTGEPDASATALRIGPTGAWLETSF